MASLASLKPVRVKAGVLMLVLAAFFSTAKLIKSTGLELDPRAVSSSRVVAYENRYRGLREVLPQNGTIGYVTGRAPEQIDVLIDREALAKYYLTQYALAPVVVVNDPSSYRLVVGNFDHFSEVYRAVPGDYSIVRDFRNGVALYSRTGR